MPFYQRKQDQWRTYVDLVFFVTSALLLVTASVLACFSLPTDIKQQTIHTVVTKPVRRFEIVIGRIIGFVGLMTVVLFVVSHLSLVYIFRGVEPEAKNTSMRARVPRFGLLQFEELDSSGNWAVRTKGENVGREWEYRQHIRGGSTQEAVWQFGDLSTDLANREWIPVEFNFDIFRTNKGGEDYREGVTCQFVFINRNRWDGSKLTEYREAKDETTGLPISDQERAGRYGYYELPIPKNVVDYETMTVMFPGAVLREISNRPFEIRVSCRSTSQYLGMARTDLYLLASEGNFYLNYLKGTLGIWFLMALIVSIGVVFSTYLSSVVGLLLTWLFMFCGVPRIRDFIDLLSEPVDRVTNPGGGPAEAALRLLRGENMVSPLEPTPGIQILLSADKAFRVLFKAFSNILPDLGQYERTMFVAEGFNIPASDIGMNFFLLAGYLFPFFLAGYYLLNVREVAQ